AQSRHPARHGAPLALDVRPQDRGNAASPPRRRGGRTSDFAAPGGATMTMGRFEKAIFLSLGQLAGLCFGMLTPILLSRWLPVADFGTYRLVILILWLTSFTLHCCMDH